MQVCVLQSCTIDAFFKVLIEESFRVLVVLAFKWLYEKQLLRIQRIAIKLNWHTCLSGTLFKSWASNLKTDLAIDYIEYLIIWIILDYIDYFQSSRIILGIQTLIWKLLSNDCTSCGSQDFIQPLKAGFFETILYRFLFL